MKLYVIRHGQSESNVGDYSKEYNIDPHLTERGVMQARLLGERLSAVDFDAILCSPLVRAVETAAQTAFRQQDNHYIEILPQLSETGTPSDFKPNISEIKKAYGRIKMLNSLGDFDNECDRAEAVIKYLLARFTHDENVLVSCHGSYNTFLLGASIGFEPPDNLIISQNNASLNLIEYFSDSTGKQIIRMKYMNDVRHLPYELIT